jgi:hypothetical protein
MWGWWVSDGWVVVEKAVLPMHVGMVGSSCRFYPCMRGWWGLRRYRWILHRVLPMHAWMVVFPCWMIIRSPCFTHACVDGGIVLSIIHLYHLFYPCMRGWWCFVSFHSSSDFPPMHVEMVGMFSRTIAAS